MTSFIFNAHWSQLTESNRHYLSTKQAYSRYTKLAKTGQPQPKHRLRIYRTWCVLSLEEDGHPLHHAHLNSEFILFSLVFRYTTKPLNCWSYERELNPRHPLYQRGTLSLSYRSFLAFFLFL